MSNDGLYTITPPSTVFTNERKYPVVFPQPSFSQIVENFRTEDYTLVGSAAAFGLPWGYWLGHKYYQSRQSAWLGLFLFGTAAFAHTTQLSAARLMGILPNDLEVAGNLANKSGK